MAANLGLIFLRYFSILTKINKLDEKKQSGNTDSNSWKNVFPIANIISTRGGDNDLQNSESRSKWVKTNQVKIDQFLPTWR